jgi:hypothetical protein
MAKAKDIFKDITVSKEKSKSGVSLGLFETDEEQLRDAVEVAFRMGAIDKTTAQKIIALIDKGNLALAEQLLKKALSKGTSGGTSTSSGGAAPTTGSSAPQQQFGNLMAMLNAIPIAINGDIITNEHHNTMRSALLIMAAQLGLATKTVAIETPITYAPSFATNQGDTAWTIAQGKAIKPGAAAKGWMSVSLPHGSTVEKMKIFGRSTGTTTGFTVKLIRQRFATDTNKTPPETTIVSVDLKTAGDPFTKEGDVLSAAQAAAAASGSNAGTQGIKEDYEEVNNDIYKYFVVAELAGAANDAVAEIHAIQIVCSG